MTPSDFAIVGAAESDLGFVPNMTPLELMAQASHRALADAGLALRDVDAVFTATAQVTLPTLALAEYLGLQPKYLDSAVHGGCSNMSHVRHAIAALNAGLCDVALIAYSSTARSELKRTGRRPAAAKAPELEAPYEPMFPVTSFALMAQRHMSIFGTTRNQLAEVAVASSQWATLKSESVPEGCNYDRRRLGLADGFVTATCQRLLSHYRRRRCTGRYDNR